VPSAKNLEAVWMPSADAIAALARSMVDA